MNDSDLRKFARAGALDMCHRAISEFPDILKELNDRTKVLNAISRPDKWTPARRKAQAERMKKMWVSKKRKK